MWQATNIKSDYHAKILASVLPFSTSPRTLYFAYKVAILSFNLSSVYAQADNISSSWAVYCRHSRDKNAYIFSKTKKGGRRYKLKKGKKKIYISERGYKFPDKRSGNKRRALRKVWYALWSYSAYIKRRKKVLDSLYSPLILHSTFELKCLLLFLSFLSLSPFFNA